MIKLVIFGIDGASFDIINPMIKKGKLKTLDRIITNGVSGPLESTFSPVTGPAWTSLATGKNPGKTGIFDFLNRHNINNYELKTITSLDIKKAGPYWDTLSSEHINNGIYNYPMLYPPYPINGFMISGLGASSNENIMFPQSLKHQLIKFCDGYKIDIPFEKKKYTRNPVLFYNDSIELLKINKKAIDFLFNLKPCVFTIVISASDFAQHFMWKYIDNSHPFYDNNEAQKYKPLFEDIWEKIDQILSDIIKKMPIDANLFIVSDHGFGSHKQTFYLNTWLQEQHFLYQKKKILDTTKMIYSKFIILLNQITRKNFSIRLVEPSFSPTAKIDLKKTRAFSNINSGAIGEIFINKSKTTPIKNIDYYTKIKDEIIQKLNLTCKHLNIDIDFYNPKDVYNGKYLEFTPDIMFILNNFECEVHSRFSTQIYLTAPPNLNHSGTHRKNGIFIAYGKDIKQGIKIDGAKIYDIAPTILFMFGVPLTIDIDGKVLREIFSINSSYAREKIQYKKYSDQIIRLKEKILNLKLNGKI